MPTSIIRGHNEIFSFFSEDYLADPDWFFWARCYKHNTSHDKFHDGNLILLDNKFLITEGVFLDPWVPYEKYLLQSNRRTGVCPIISFEVVPVFFQSLVWEIIKIEIDGREVVLS